MHRKAVQGIPCTDAHEEQGAQAEGHDRDFETSKTSLLMANQIRERCRRGAHGVLLTTHCSTGAWGQALQVSASVPAHARYERARQGAVPAWRSRAQLRQALSRQSS